MADNVPLITLFGSRPANGGEVMFDGLTRV